MAVGTCERIPLRLKSKKLANPLESGKPLEYPYAFADVTEVMDVSRLRRL
jgi:hypothetical protein